MKKKNTKLKIIYYSDELNDDFAGTNINSKKTPDNFIYIHKNIIFRFFAFALYHFIGIPVLWIYNKISLHHKFINRKQVTKKLKGKACFIYGNHTLIPEDAFIPAFLMHKKNYLVANPDAISIPGVKTIVEMLGVYPLPSTLNSHKNFSEGIIHLNKDKKNVTIYPEAHIWKYYTGIRPFTSASFCYPVECNAPVVALTSCFFKSRNPFRKRPVVKTYVSGPFYPDLSLPRNEAMKKLRDEVYESMVYESNKQEQYKYKYDYIKKVV